MALWRLASQHTTYSARPQKGRTLNGTKKVAQSVNDELMGAGARPVLAKRVRVVLLDVGVARTRLGEPVLDAGCEGVRVRTPALAALADVDLLQGGLLVDAEVITDSSDERGEPVDRVVLGRRVFVA